MTPAENAQLRQMQAQIERLQQQINNLTVRLLPVEKDLAERVSQKPEPEPTEYEALPHGTDAGER